MTIAAIGLYVVIDIVLVFLEPSLSVAHNAESDYGSGGSWAWLMDVNFMLRCLLSLAMAAAISSASHRGVRLPVFLVCIAVWALTSGLLAFFPDDPAGTVLRPSGRVHLALASLGFLAVLLGTIVGTRALRPQARWNSLRVPLLALSWGGILPLAALGRTGFGPHTFGGAYEKVFLASQLAWFVVALWPLSRTAPAPQSPQPGGRSRSRADARGAGPRTHRQDSGTELSEY